MPDLICFYTIAYKTCLAFILSQIKKAALRAAAKLRPKKGYGRRAVSLRLLRSGKQQNPVYDKKGERKARPIGL